MSVWEKLGDDVRVSPIVYNERWASADNCGQTAFIALFCPFDTSHVRAVHPESKLSDPERGGPLQV